MSSAKAEAAAVACRIATTNPGHLLRGLPPKLIAVWCSSPAVVSIKISIRLRLSPRNLDGEGRDLRLCHASPEIQALLWEAASGGDWPAEPRSLIVVRAPSASGYDGSAHHRLPPLLRRICEGRT
ncbi:unnamed protein product [Caenorhabditis auriculariae]|uniref:Uncharacterized protein n=1 Tax=Caenorhabditis auriculariae TaxID=2777116 RepID=A0A8S1H1X1_9PELO|nr:unnamed protein product [Caenorhabditis auriculariae]